MAAVAGATLPTALQRGLIKLAENVQDLWVPPAVPRRAAESLSPLEFLRDFVAASQPVVLTNLRSEEWPCLDKWSDEYLLKAAGDLEVTVNLTPKGLGDFVDPSSGLFVKPLEERMRFGDFFQGLLLCTRQDEGEGERDREEEAAAVPYLSHQNDSLREQLPTLAGDVPRRVPLGLEAFGNEPEAVNLWIGDSRAMSSCHKDHYENLYVVVRGCKIFTLLPPATVPFLYERRCTSAQYVRSKSTDGRSVLKAVPDDKIAEEGAAKRVASRAADTPVPSVPWVPVDVSTPDLESFPDFALAAKVEVRVGPGEMLYLPAMWYHQVAQEGITVAVNYWHDMPFGHFYIHHSFIRDVLSLNEEEEARQDEQA